MFFNSLRLTWQMSLWADSAVLLRTMAWLDTPTQTSLPAGLQPQQLEFGLASEKQPEMKTHGFLNESPLSQNNFRNTLFERPFPIIENEVVGFLTVDSMNNSKVCE